jgi:YihY family inner membrane protein
MKEWLAKVDRYQRAHAWLGFPIGVFKKFGEDRAGQLAALVAYYGFFSMFPLLLVAVTVLGYLLGGDEAAQARILDSALSQFPVIGDQIRDNIGAISGSGLALAVGIGGALWAGLAGIKAAQNAMDNVWNVPFKRQPNFLRALVRAIAMLATLGTFVLLSSFLGGVAAGTDTRSTLLQVAGVAGSFILNFLVFWVGFRVLTVAKVSFRDVLPGALVAAVVWSALQAAGGYIIGHRLESSTQLYGFFAVVIGLLSWIYLGAQITLLAAEVNVVRVKGLWPRALRSDDLTEQDRRALEDAAKVEERREEQHVGVRFDDEGAAPESSEGSRTLLKADDRNGDRPPPRKQNGRRAGTFAAGAVAGAAAAEILRRRRERDG